MGIGKAIGSAALGGLTGGVGGLVSGAIGGLGSLMGIGSRKERKAREAEEREHQRQLEYMGLQAKYNKEQAEYSTELSKEMWDYTNFENQVKHLKAAGLNPALIYGSGGGGGGNAAGSGSAAGVGLPSSTGVGMGIQWEQMEAQKELAKAEAAKTNAEAAKLMTTDTKNVESNTEKNKTYRDWESKGLEFNNYLNELRKNIELQGEVNGNTVWTKGFDEIFKAKELQKMLADYGISQREYRDWETDRKSVV